MTEQLEFDFDDLTPEEQNVYLKAAQRLLSSDAPDEDGTEVCAACGAPAGEGHRSWCPFLLEGTDASA